MKDKFFAVIDTNVIVSALISKNIDSNPGKVFRAIVQERIVPLYNDEILAEYRCVLSRPKFHLAPALIETVLKAIIVDGLNLDRVPATGIDFPDPKDIVLYEIAISKENAYLVTGNIKHFPVRSFIVSPAEMVEILGDD
jgi:probable toxin-antitoxin system toxin component, PIN family